MNRRLIVFIFFCVSSRTICSGQITHAADYVPPFTAVSACIHLDYETVKSAIITSWGWEYAGGNDSMVEFIIHEDGLSDWREASNILILFFKNSTPRIITGVSYATTIRESVPIYLKAIRDGGYRFVSESNSDIVTLSYYERVGETIVFSDIHYPKTKKRYYGWIIQRTDI